MALSSQFLFLLLISILGVLFTGMAISSEVNGKGKKLTILQIISFVAWGFACIASVVGVFLSNQ